MKLRMVDLWAREQEERYVHKGKYVLQPGDKKQQIEKWQQV
jgi:hypothetical protein